MSREVVVCGISVFACNDDTQVFDCSNELGGFKQLWGENQKGSPVDSHPRGGRHGD